jgi:hypothetical protein
VASNAEPDAPCAAGDDDDTSAKVGGRCIGHSRSVVTVIAQYLDFVSS